MIIILAAEREQHADSPMIIPQQEKDVLKPPSSNKNVKESSDKDRDGDDDGDDDDNDDDDDMIGNKLTKKQLDND